MRLRGDQGSRRGRRAAAAGALALLALGVGLGPAAAQDNSPPAAAASDPAPLVPEARAASTALAPVSSPTPPPAETTVKLSNESTLTRWAYVDRATIARRAPSRTARRVKRLSIWTADGTPELTVALAERRLASGAVWVKVRLPMRPNGRTGWVPRSALSAYRKVTTQFRIDRRRFRARLYRNGKRIWSARIGVGKRQWPTPRGRFYIRERLIPARKNTIYGVFAFGTSAYSDVLTDWPGGGVVGIHGTNQPGLIPGRISHGCIRVRNRSISRLRRLMPLGTPVRIR